MNQDQYWTYDQYVKLNTDTYYEIINGSLVMSPSPGFAHQKVSAILEFYFRQFVETHKLGILLYAPFDVILSENLVFQPDILFVSNENKKIIKEAGIFGAPDLVIEIISPLSGQRDRYYKYISYEKYKVKEYWIVDPKHKSVEVFTLQKDTYELYEIQINTGVIHSKLLDGFQVEISELFVTFLENGDGI